MGYKSIRQMTLPYVHSTASAIPQMGHILSLYMYRSLCMEYLLFFPTSEGFKFHLLCEDFPDYLVDSASCVYVYPVSLPHWLWGDKDPQFRNLLLEPSSQWVLMKELMSK